MTTVVIPFRTKGEPWRDHVHDWVVGRWRTLLPSSEVRSVDSGRDPFCHASSINLGAAQAPSGVLIVSDADTAVNPDVLATAATIAETGGWALAERYCALTEPQSHQALTLEELLEPADPEWLGIEKSWAGFLAIDRDMFVELGGYDERIWGWGPDDVAIAAKFHTLIGPPARVPGTVFHLWHERSLDDTYGVEGYHAKRDLAEAYLAAKGDPGAMRKVMT